MIGLCVYKLTGEALEKVAVPEDQLVLFLSPFEIVAGRVQNAL